MIRVLAIALTAAACAALYYGYMNLNMLRGTPLFDFRYVVFGIAAFLGLSALEWALGWIKTKTQGPDADH